LGLLSNPRISAVETVLDGYFAPHPLAYVPRYRWDLSSDEAALLLKHGLAEARLLGLRILQSIADRRAVELALPALRDPNPIVRKGAFFFFRTVSGRDFSPDDAAKWEQWWVAKRESYKPLHREQER
jgi:hypothetical protein